MNQKPLDYSKDSNWLIKQSNGKQKVDYIYFMPSTTDPNFKGDISPIDDYVRKHFLPGFKKVEAIFGDYTNCFVPFMRQISDYAINKYGADQTIETKIAQSIVKKDAFAALDYYFKHFNKGKPFILSGLCQGGFLCKMILAEYMPLHPQYYARMIAAYMPGTCINQKYLKANPHVKPAKGEVDLGVVVCWNTEGENPKLPNPFIWDKPICINPLNWKTDSTYAGISKNLGSWDWKKFKYIDGIADGYIDLNRHVVVTTTAIKKGYKPFPCNDKPLLGDQSYHLYEWDFFCVNVKENALKRIKQWFKIKH